MDFPFSFENFTRKENENQQHVISGTEINNITNDPTQRTNVIVIVHKKEQQRTGASRLKRKQKFYSETLLSIAILISL